jgi:hypothetical protein
MLYKHASVGRDPTMFCASSLSKRWSPLALLLCMGCGANPITYGSCPADRPLRDPGHGCKAPAVTEAATPSYVAVIVTDAYHAEAYGRLADLHTLTGVPTEVVTVEEICAASSTGCLDGDACHDTARAIKEHLASRYAAGLRHVVMGGDMTVVPSRQTHDVYANLLLGVAYQKTFYTDYYFADLSEWDGNGDCLYGDPGVDTPDYLPELAVSRIPIASPAELEAYLAKALRYLTAYDTTRVGTALFLSNVATELALGATSETIAVDSAYYFETAGRTLSLVPPGFAVTKLYSSLVDLPDVSPISVSAEIAALEEGQNLVIHAGHGGVGDLTVESDGSQAFTAAMAYDLRNPQLPIMLSCACEAADFTGEVPAAGRSFVAAPLGGGIGYLGNVTIGLGLAGGLQLIDEVLRHAFAEPGVPVGEAVRVAHGNLPRTDTFELSGLPVVGSLSMQVIDENAWRWTQKSATYLGDGLLPIYTDVSLVPAPTFSIASQHLGSFVTITFQPAVARTGTLTVSIAGEIYQLVLTGDGQPVSLTVGGSPASLTYGFASSTTLAAYRQTAIP